ncbi:hypothetical protein L7F22_066776 [Adiantum nelumboides]|nr:hypothetical protein [Adiantum nelumboides]
MKGSQNLKWTPEAQKAFEEIKVVMTTLPVLKLPEFDKPFEIHADASRIPLGGVLMQEGRPVAYLSKKFFDREKRWASHEQEMYAIVYCLDQWRHYVLDKHTKVYTDNVSLKYFQTQPKLSPKQMRWQGQLAEYDIEIIHKPRKHNVMPDSLSRMHEINAVSVINSDEILDQIKNASKTDLGVLRMMQNWRQGKTTVGLFDLGDGLWYAHDRIYVPDEPSLKAKLLWETHDCKIAGHGGQKRSFEKFSHHFYWRKMQEDVVEYVHTCSTCQLVKAQRIRPAAS